MKPFRIFKPLLGVWAVACTIGAPLCRAEDGCRATGAWDFDSINAPRRVQTPKEDASVQVDAMRRRLNELWNAHHLEGYGV